MNDWHQANQRLFMNRLTGLSMREQELGEHYGRRFGEEDEILNFDMWCYVYGWRAKPGSENDGY